MTIYFLVLLIFYLGTRRLRFEQLDEPYMKSFKEVFKKLTDV